MSVKSMILLLLCIFSSVSGEVFSERTILLQLKSSVSDPSGILSSWNPNTTANHCSWFGISCDSKSRVVSVNITGCSDLCEGNFSSCSKFSFHGFGIRRRGTSCLHGNGKLVGELSPLIGKLGELRVLSLAFNEFSGEIPVDIWGLEKLEVLNLEGNLFNGRLPNEFVGLRKLRVLNLGFNRIDGEIPFSIKKCEGLEVLSLEGNNLKGMIPGFFGSLLKLREIYLSYNELNGSIPRELASSCRFLEHLDLSGNLLVGRIPGNLGKCRQLRTLLLFSNMLNGAIPRELGWLRKLEVLDVSRNSLNGLIPAELGNCVELSVLVLSNLFDPLLNDRFTREELLVGSSITSAGDNNSFHGSIPVEITTLSKLRIVWAPKVNLEGRLPSSWGGCKSLEMVNLAQNHLSGVFIRAFDRCKNLHYIDLSSNKLTGMVPGSLGNLKSLVHLDLSGNKIQGHIPTSLHQLRYLKHLSLAGNNVTGHIPSSIGRLRSLKMLDLSWNSLSGEIPPSLVNLRNLTVLLLNNNRLKGKIPSGLANLTSLSTYNASFNNLSGSLPGNGKVMNCSGVLGNPFIRSCGIFLSSSKLTNSDEDPPTGNNTDDSRMTAIEIASIVSASAIVLVLLVLVIVFFCTRKRVSGSRVQVSEPREITLFVDIGVSLTYENIVHATGNFNSSNCIGSGGFGATYKAEISPEIVVAIKRLSIGRLQGVQQFQAEIKTLGSVRHPNLVTLIGYQASETEMFLIYNYLAGGNLENFIQERSAKAVDWKIIHKISLGVASALAYLHDQCAPRVLHRDVKPSNILLDSDFNAYLSDFGLSRLLATSQTHATTGVHGTFGYVAPEYAMTCRVSEKADVYSYGVVLLELISDKKALDPSFSSHGNGFNIVSWACMLLRQGQAKDVFTAGLWNTGPHDDLVDMLHLAVKCTVDTLSTRPTMKQVVQSLKRIRPPAG